MAWFDPHGGGEEGRSLGTSDAVSATTLPRLPASMFNRPTPNVAN
jgi:hypothetical protein